QRYIDLRGQNKPLHIRPVSRPKLKLDVWIAPLKNSHDGGQQQRRRTIGSTDDQSIDLRIFRTVSKNFLQLIDHCQDRRNVVQKQITRACQYNSAVALLE